MIHLSFQTFLASDELGNSLNGVEVLIKKHENFDKTLVAWEEKFKASQANNHNIILFSSYRLLRTVLRNSYKLIITLVKTLIPEENL